MNGNPRKIGKYEILEELGRGAMGTVFQARDPVLDRLVAIKLMSEELVIEEEMQARFEREARSAARLQHPNIVTVFDFGGHDGERSTPYIVMELLDGVSLAHLMEQRRPERLEDKLHLVAQVCEGLDFAHKRGVVHRDVKPGNIQVLPNGTAKILDFGIAWGEGSTIKTKTGLVMGTPNYMAPEQIATDVVDHRADMWAVGVILYELLSAERPFVATTVPSLVYQIVHAAPAPLDPCKLDIPRGLVSIVDRVLRKNPDERFEDLAHLRRAIESIVSAPSSRGEVQAEGSPDDYATHVRLAKRLLRTGEPRRALEAARRAQAVLPRDSSVADLLEEIEIALARMRRRTPAPAEMQDWTRWVDEARMALTAGERSEALRIVEDVLAVAPGFEPAVELKGLLDKPERPRRARTGSLRPQTYRRARVRPAPSFKAVATFGEPPGIQVLAPAPEPEVVAVGGVDGSIRTWELRSRRKLASLRTSLHRRAGHEALVTSLAFSPDGSLLVSGHVDGRIHVWRYETGEEIEARARHDASVGGLAFSPDGTTLASGGLDATLKLWDVEHLRRGEPQRRLVRQPSGVTAVAYSLDGVLLITGHNNRVLRVHDARTGRLTATLRGHGAAVNVIALAPDGNHVATGGRDGSVRIFDINRREEMHALTVHKKPVASLSYFPGGHELASVAMDESLVIWNAASGHSRATLWGASNDAFTGVSVLGEAPWIVAALASGSLRLWAPE